MPLGMYDTATLLQAVEQLQPKYTFLYDTFVRNLGAVEDEEAIYDFRKGDRVMAPFVTNGAGGQLMEREGFETRKIGFPTIAPERPINMTDINKRGFGEAVLGAKTPEQRAREMVGKDLADMHDAIQRRREWMAMKVLLTGKLEIFRYTNEGRELHTTCVADYGFTNNFTPVTPWNQAGCDIEGDMESMTDMVQDGGGAVGVVVMAPNVAAAMRLDTGYFKLMDGLNVKAGEINQKYLGQGVRFLGYNADGAEMYSFAGKYQDDDGNLKPILPSGTILVGAQGVLKAAHGPVTQVEEPGPNAIPHTYIKEEVPLRIGSVDFNNIKNRLTSRPTIVPFNVDAWVVGHVL